MNILITSASRKVSLVKAFQQALAQEGGGQVIAVDASPLSPALYLADEHYLVARSECPEHLPALLKLCEKRRIALLVPTRDEELPVFAEQHQAFAEVGTRVMTPDPETVSLCQDKARFLDFCRKHGFGTPVTYSPSEPIAAFPVFVKPRVGKGGKDLHRADSREELARMLAQMPDAIIQELVSAPEYTVDLFADFSGQVISTVPRERIRIFGGESFVSRTHKHEGLMRESIRLAEALRLVGHNTVQCFLCGDDIQWIEVNPRFGGAAHLGFAAGAPTPHFLVKLLKGEQLSPRIGDFRDNCVMLRYTDDLFRDAADLTRTELPG